MTYDYTIVVDYATCPDIKTISELHIEKLLDPKWRDTIPLEKCQMRRYMRHLDKEKVVPIKFKNKKGLEFINTFDLPTINEKFRYKRYCYAYGMVMKGDGLSVSNFKLVKKNVCDDDQDLYCYK